MPASCTEVKLGEVGTWLVSLSLSTSVAHVPRPSSCMGIPYEVLEINCKFIYHDILLRPSHDLIALLS